MSQLTVRPAIAPERAALEALQRRASLNNPNDRAALLANPDAIELTLKQIVDWQVFVAEQAGRIKGFSALVPRADGNFELDALFVEPESWRQGIGRALIEHARNVVVNAGAMYLHVVGNPHAERFYTACLFEIVGVEEARFGQGLLMRKSVE